MPIGRTDGFPRAIPFRHGFEDNVPSLVIPLVSWNLLVSFFAVALADHLEVQCRQPSAQLAAQSRSCRRRIRCSLQVQPEIKIRRLEIVQSVIHLIHPVGLSFLLGGITDSDCFQIKQCLSVPAYQKIWMCRDSRDVGMEFDLEPKAKEHVV